MRSILFLVQTISYDGLLLCTPISTDPGLNFDFIFREEEEDFDDMDDMNCTKNEDDLEEAEMRLLQRQLDQGQHVTESQEEKDYKAEFFELLDEVKWWQIENQQSPVYDMK